MADRIPRGKRRRDVMTRGLAATAALAALLSAMAGCWHVGPPGDQYGADGDADSDTGGDTDSDTAEDPEPLCE